MALIASSAPLIGPAGSGGGHQVAETEYALSMATIAARRLQTRQKLSLSELCELVQALDAARKSITQRGSLFVRGLMKELLTPEERQAWDTWWATHPKDAAENAAFLHDRIALYEEGYGLIDRGVAPASAAGQQLIKRYNALLEKYGVRERTLRTLDWNDSVTTRFMSMEAEARAREPRSARLPRPFASQELCDFMDAARTASTWSLIGAPSSVPDIDQWGTDRPLAIVRIAPMVRFASPADVSSDPALRPVIPNPQCKGTLRRESCGEGRFAKTW